MMELVFLACWTTVFIGGGVLVARRFVNRTRAYLLMLLNLVFLSGVFYFYPMVLQIEALP